MRWRILDNLGIKYEIFEYNYDEENFDAIHVTSILKIQKEQVFKTIVVYAAATPLLHL